MNKKNIIRTVAAAVLALSAASCMTPEKLLYLQDMQHGSQIEIENQIEAVIVPYDELDIMISCSDPEIAKPFNIRTAMGGTTTQGSFTYVVDPHGNVQLPIIGEIHAAGMTRLKLQQTIQEILIGGGYISDPYVMVRFYNFKIFFLGANGGKSITIANERCTFLEALSLSGDLNQYIMRDKIGVVRMVDGKMTMRYLDPRSSDVFNDPYFMLQQNDIIITRANSSKYWKEEISYWSSWLSIGSAVTSIVTTGFVFANYFKKDKE